MALCEGENMTKRVLLIIGIYLCTMSVLAFAKDQTWNGWISDSRCGVKGANASHMACAKKCVQAGAKPVFVSDTEQKVIPVANPEMLRDHLGEHVKVVGTMSNGSIRVDKVDVMSQ
jgi:hypothetical protein